jgi:hypothetical protein
MLTRADQARFAGALELFRRAGFRLAETDPVEIRVAIKVLHAVNSGATSWIDQLEMYKRALIEKIEERHMYLSIPCAQNSVVSVMLALQALVMGTRRRIVACGATPHYMGDHGMDSKRQ